MLVQDSYPEKLLQEWDSGKNNHDSENERPGGCTGSANTLHLTQFFKLKCFTQSTHLFPRFSMHSLVFLYVRFSILFIALRITYNDKGYNIFTGG